MLFYSLSFIFILHYRFIDSACLVGVVSSSLSNCLSSPRTQLNIFNAASRVARSHIYLVISHCVLVSRSVLLRLGKWMQFKSCEDTDAGRIRLVDQVTLSILFFDKALTGSLASSLEALLSGMVAFSGLIAPKARFTSWPVVTLTRLKSTKEKFR